MRDKFIGRRELGAPSDVGTWFKDAKDGCQTGLENHDFSFDLAVGEVSLDSSFCRGLIALRDDDEFWGCIGLRQQRFGGRREVRRPSHGHDTLTLGPGTSGPNYRGEDMSSASGCSVSKCISRPPAMRTSTSGKANPNIPRMRSVAGSLPNAYPTGALERDEEVHRYRIGPEFTQGRATSTISSDSPIPKLATEQGEKPAIPVTMTTT
ncbi:hypothetical protein [Mycobacterium parmense]|uniref:Uncharacterized protein n=1 Tax=Mycobacterium parmense TaxID=185642 RepID=A0A7I7YPY2_9MYCO|nr:hypothetical protein [Mycobacterium parmense]MCV7349652.1 hypothetical protein [Mycobacterium parmense]BBZ43699.1 hypothetical protein MPRM_09800 [Mycobacterium parmense]